MGHKIIVMSPISPILPVFEKVSLYWPSGDTLRKTGRIGDIGDVEFLDIKKSE